MVATCNATHTHTHEVAWAHQGAHNRPQLHPLGCIGGLTGATAMHTGQVVWHPITPWAQQPACTTAHGHTPRLGAALPQGAMVALPSNGEPRPLGVG